MGEIDVRGGSPEDRAWLTEVMGRGFAGTVQVRREEAVDAARCPLLVAEAVGRRVGVAVYRPDGDECELVFIESLVPNRGVGRALVDALREAARPSRRLWVSTTNDNLNALRFYQRNGFHLCALRPGAVDHGRERLKPAIPEVRDGIPIRDELELEMWLDDLR